MAGSAGSGRTSRVDTGWPTLREKRPPPHLASSCTKRRHRCPDTPKPHPATSERCAQGAHGLVLVGATVTPSGSPLAVRVTRFCLVAARWLRWVVEGMCHGAVGPPGE